MLVSIRRAHRRLCAHASAVPEARTNENRDGFAGESGWRRAALLAAGAATATATSQILKRTFRRPRPRTGIAGIATLLEDPDAFSFPSGHTAVAFGVAAALAAGDLRVATLELLLASGIGCSHVWLGAHYPADVVAGALLGVVSGVVAASAILAIAG